MTGLRPQSDDLCDLVDLLFDEQLDAAGTDRLSRMLAGNEDALRLYVSELTLRANLAWDWGMRDAGQGDWQPGMDAPPAAGARHDGEDAEGPAAWDGLPAAAAHPHGVLPLHPLSFLVQPLTALAGNVVLCYALCALLFAGGMLGAMAIEPLAIRSVAVGSAREARSPGPPPTWRGRVTKEVGCRWADPATGPQNAAGGKIELADGMFEITFDSGVTVTTMAGPVAYQVLSPDAIRITRGLVVVLTPPISGRVVTCLGLHGEPFLAAALSTPARRGHARQGSAPQGAGSPFHVLTPALSFADRGGVALCIKVESPVTTIAHCYDGRVDFQALRDGRTPRPTMHLDSRGWVYVDGRPNGEQVVVVGTDGAVPPSLAKRLPKMVFPAYSQQSRPTAPGQKPGPGA